MDGQTDPSYDTQAAMTGWSTTKREGSAPLTIEAIAERLAGVKGDVDTG